MSLAGKGILITRPAEQSAELRREIERRGGRVFILPAIRILPPENWEECDRAIQELSSFDGIAFTSANAVEAFFERCATLSVGEATMARINAYAVGEKTARALERRGSRAHHIPDQYSGKGLVESLPKVATEGKSFLLPRGDRARDDLPEGLVRRGAKVTPVTVYRTAGPDEITIEEIRRVFRERLIDVVTFFSPSAVAELLTIVDENTRAQLGAGIWTAVIGETTRAALECQGVPVSLTAPQATASSLLAAIEQFGSKDGIS